MCIQKVSVSMVYIFSLFPVGGVCIYNVYSIYTVNCIYPHCCSTCYALISVGSSAHTDDFDPTSYIRYNIQFDFE
jgi:hypothetical protein